MPTCRRPSWCSIHSAVEVTGRQVLCMSSMRSADTRACFKSPTWPSSPSASPPYSTPQPATRVASPASSRETDEWCRVLCREEIKSALHFDGIYAKPILLGVSHDESVVLTIPVRCSLDYGTETIRRLKR